MKIAELKDKFRSEEIDKKEYGALMFNEYEKLQHYCQLLEDSPVEQIVINKCGVEAHIKSELAEQTNLIKMRLYKSDAAAVPSTILSFGEYEQLELQTTGRMISFIKDCVVFDIGANLGWYTLNICKRFPDVRCFAFEPIDETINKLKETLQLNEISNAEIYNFGFMDYSGELDFFYDTVASGASSIADLRELPTTKVHKCTVKTMDDFVTENNVPRIDFIKCDVEGAELFVYKGGIQSLEKFKPIVFSEMLRKWSAKCGYHPNQIIEIFKDLGYSCYILEENGSLTKFGEVTDETEATNYFFLHNEKHRDIISYFVK